LGRLRRLLRPPAVPSAAGRAAGRTTWTGSVRGHAPLVAEATVEEQLQHLRSRVTTLQEDHAALLRELQRSRRQLASRIDTVDTDAVERDSTLETSLHRVAAASARQEIWGLAAVVVGTTISAFG
jgi:ABC-type enterochelin transport system substrate-binding protein